VAYTTALRDFPPLPAPQGQFTDANGRPTREFYTFLTQLRAWQETATAALEQVEPLTFTVGTLPAAASSANQRYLVTDANASTFNSIVAGGGANIVPVFSTGAAWRIG
jgi:hypothetical protein